MNIFDAEKQLIERQSGLLTKANVIPVSLKRLSIQTENGCNIDLDRKKHFIGQDWWLRLDTLAAWEITGPDGSKASIPAISAVDSNGGDLGRVPVAMFFL